MPSRTGHFGRGDRLRRSWEFQRISRIGRREAARSFVMIVASSVSQESSGHRLGVTVSRRVGGAVIRNRIKRRIRAWFRQNRGELVASSDLVVIARRPAADLSGLATQAELSKLLRAVGGRGS